MDIQDFSILNSSQQRQWQKFVADLQMLNSLHYRSRAKQIAISAAVNIYKSKTQALPPNYNLDELGSLKRKCDIMARAVTALNTAYGLTQAGTAAVAVSTSYPGELDIVASRELLTDAEIQAATFNRGALSTIGIGPLVPILVAGGAMVTAIIVAGIVSSVNEAAVTQKRIDLELNRAENTIVQDMKADPEIFAMWTKYKGQLATKEKGFMQSLSSGLGSIVTVGAIALIGYLIFKAVSSVEK